MSRDVVILFGTESGNAELAAEDMAAEVVGREVEIIDMSDFQVDSFTPEKFYLIICSTHGEGDLPTSAIPMWKALDVYSTNLNGIEFAIFGLGDSTYENYSKGSEHIETKLTSLGVSRVGEYGRHDASSGTLPNDSAVAWSKIILSEY